MSNGLINDADLICLSHLRWDFVFQRPQHLMSRFARHRRVFFVEEPHFGVDAAAVLRTRTCEQTGVIVATPHLPERSRAEANSALAILLRTLIRQERIKNYIAWYYTPMALAFSSDNFAPMLTIYDCMDELSLFRGAPPELLAHEERLLRRADLVFTGGASLFEAKRSRHPRVYAFPSGVDIHHFKQARACDTEPEEQAHISHPRLGYAGVIDERIDMNLIRQVAEARPEWQFVMIGPVVKIDPASLPRAANIHWLGMKDYSALPRFFSGWDLAMMPFAMNDSTRYISPTKTPEYLAAGLPVVSTPIRDVVRPYGELGLARIAGNPIEFEEAANQALTFGMSLKWRERADAFIQTLSWDDTWSSMNALIVNSLKEKQSADKYSSRVAKSGPLRREEVAGV